MRAWLKAVPWKDVVWFVAYMVFTVAAVVCLYGVMVAVRQGVLVPSLLFGLGIGCCLYGAVGALTASCTQSASRLNESERTFDFSIASHVVNHDYTRISEACVPNALGMAKNGFTAASDIFGVVYYAVDGKVLAVSRDEKFLAWFGDYFEFMKNARARPRFFTTRRTSGDEDFSQS